jgi:hypothetical protein
MPREIDILASALRKGCAIVEKETNILWTEEDLRTPALAERFEQEGRLDAPEPGVGPTGVFPGCLQQFSRPLDLESYRAVGQTAHFLIFVPPSPPAGAGCPARDA